MSHKRALSCTATPQTASNAVAIARLCGLRPLMLYTADSTVCIMLVERAFAAALGKSKQRHAFPYATNFLECILLPWN